MIFGVLAGANSREIETSRRARYHRQEVPRQCAYRANMRLAPAARYRGVSARRGDDDRRRRRQIMSHSDAGSALARSILRRASTRDRRVVEITGGDWRRSCTAVRKLNAVR